MKAEDIPSDQASAEVLKDTMEKSERCVFYLYVCMCGAGTSMQILQVLLSFMVARV